MTNNIDTIFKKKAEDIPVDTGMMEKDWDAMAMLLAPTTPPATKTAGSMLVKKILFAFTITTAAVVAAYLLVKKQPAVKHASLAVNAATGVKQQQPVNQHTTGDTIIIKSTPIKINNQAVHIDVNNLQDSILRKTTARVLLDTTASDINRQHKITLTVKPFIDTPKRVVIITDTAGLKIPVPFVKIKSDGDILDSFYNLLKTPTQLFAIDNTRDTTIIGKDSSEITIPANCFTDSAGHLVNKNVVIHLDECYSYVDIIANKLNTTSDGNPLESGGMLQIKAKANNRELKLNGAKSLLVKMPAKKIDNDMQLFVPRQPKPAVNARNVSNGKAVNNGIEGRLPERDTVLVYDAMPGINWMAAGQLQYYNNLPPVKVLNLQNQPFITAYRPGKLIGTFRVVKKCALTKKQITAELMKRYNYGEIKIRWYHHTPEFTSNVYFWNSQAGRYEENRRKVYIGDSVNIPASEADRYNLWVPGQREAYLKKLQKNAVYRQAVANLEKKYAFTVPALGWINCDRFYGDPRPKVRYVINLEDTADKYISQLVFLNSRLAMAAGIRGNDISFANLPVGEPVQLVSVGVRKGKVVACIKKMAVSKEVVTGLQFEEVTVDGFKKQLQSADMK